MLLHVLAAAWCVWRLTLYQVRKSKQRVLVCSGICERGLFNYRAYLAYMRIANVGAARTSSFYLITYVAFDYVLGSTRKAAFAKAYTILGERVHFWARLARGLASR